jgi:hypothetical protein
VLIGVSLVPATTVAGLISINLREGSTTVGGTSQGALNIVAKIRTQHFFVISGLTPGTSHTYKLAAIKAAGATGTIGVDPIIMTAQAAL